jgi:hypothetical protein
MSVAAAATRVPLKSLLSASISVAKKSSNIIKSVQQSGKLQILNKAPDQWYDPYGNFQEKKQTFFKFFFFCFVFSSVTIADTKAQAMIASSLQNM